MFTCSHVCRHQSSISEWNPYCCVDHHCVLYHPAKGLDPTFVYAYAGLPVLGVYEASTRMVSAATLQLVACVFLAVLGPSGRVQLSMHTQDACLHGMLVQHQFCASVYVVPTVPAERR